MAKLQAVPGAMTMYNLEVAQDQTYTVGHGQWVVHNCGYVNNNPQATPDEIRIGELLNNSLLEKVQGTPEGSERSGDYRPTEVEGIAIMKYIFY